jgi:hypothetical protein
VKQTLTKKTQKIGVNDGNLLSAAAATAHHRKPLLLPPLLPLLSRGSSGGAGVVVGGPAGESSANIFEPRKYQNKSFAQTTTKNKQTTD